MHYSKFYKSRNLNLSNKRKNSINKIKEYNNNILNYINTLYKHITAFTVSDVTACLDHETDLKYFYITRKDYSKLSKYKGFYYYGCDVVSLDSELFYSKNKNGKIDYLFTDCILIQSKGIVKLHVVGGCDGHTLYCNKFADEGKNLQKEI